MNRLPLYERLDKLNAALHDIEVKMGNIKRGMLITEQNIAASILEDLRVQYGVRIFIGCGLWTTKEFLELVGDNSHDWPSVVYLKSIFEGTGCVMTDRGIYQNYAHGSIPHDMLIRMRRAYLNEFPNS